PQHLHSFPTRRSSDLAFKPIEKTRIDQNPRQGIFNSLIKSAQLAPVLVKPHQRFETHVRVIERLPESPAGERFQNLIRARRLLRDRKSTRLNSRHVAI